MENLSESEAIAPKNDPIQFLLIGAGFLIVLIMVTTALAGAWLTRTKSDACNANAPLKQHYHAIIKDGKWYCGTDEVWKIVLKSKNNNVSIKDKFNAKWHEDRYPELVNGKVVFDNDSSSAQESEAK